MEAVLLDDVSKSFERVVLRSGYTTLKTALTSLITRSGRAAPSERVEALHGVSLSIPQGATLGLLGNYLPGYAVTWPGAFVGLVYGAAIGALAGWSLARVYNRLARAR